MNTAPRILITAGVLSAAFVVAAPVCATDASEKPCPEDTDVAYAVTQDDTLWHIAAQSYCLDEWPPLVWGVGTGTPGYWKNHPEAWPGPVTVGGVQYVNAQTATPPAKTMYDAIKLMGKVSGDKTISMFAALISAKLNSMLANNTVCIAETIGKADVWMAAHPVGSNVKASSTAWSVGADEWHTLLDDYNNGKLCAPHRD